eukprot:scaffold220_cov169-Amphora_coffeaeformis.AAC.4
MLDAGRTTKDGDEKGKAAAVRRKMRERKEFVSRNKHNNGCCADVSPAKFKSEKILKRVLSKSLSRR